MKQSIQNLPYTIGAPSMVFGKDMVNNVRRLVAYVSHVEILIFYTPELNNIPTSAELAEIRAIGNGEGISFSIHLPSSLEVASPDHSKRQFSIELAQQCLIKAASIKPLHYILHVPYSPPTLVAVPGDYHTVEPADRRHGEWIGYAMESLETLHDSWCYPGSLLVENINYSPAMLEPLWNRGLCEFCLDIGHLRLGNEDVEAVLKRYLPVTREIHLHGVRGYEEHLSLAANPPGKLLSWLSILQEHFRGILNLEVFSPDDLVDSLAIMDTLTGSIGNL